MFQVNGLTRSCEVWGYGRKHGRGISLLAGTGYNSQKPKLSLDSTATCTSIKKNSSGCTSDGMNCHTFEDSTLQLYQEQCTVLVHSILQQWVQLSAAPLPWLNTCKCHPGQSRKLDCTLDWRDSLQMHTCVLFQLICCCFKHMAFLNCCFS